MSHTREATVRENQNGPYGQTITVGNYSFIADEPTELGGLGQGPDPYEILLGALGACTTMTLRMYATQKGFPPFTQSVHLAHHKETGEDGLKLDVFERTLILEGDLTTEQREKLLEIANKCPVGRTLEKGSKIVTTLQ
jgi:putative redox protein